MFGTINSDQLRENHRHCIEESINSKREPNWTEAVAVGSKDFVVETKSKLEANTRGRNFENSGDDFVLKETQNPYNTVFATKKGFLSPINEYYWDVY